MPLVINTQNAPITAAQTPPTLQTQGLVVPADATELHLTTSGVQDMDSYTLSAYALIDDEVPFGNGTRSTYGPTPFVPTAWPLLTSRSKSVGVHVIVPVSSQRRVWVGITDIDNPGAAPEVVLRAKWV